ncbi:hypothetical protein HYFRA_00000889 [Hymenoscyphus fraxineus]|uniref:Extracellular membrane protein CFEM domain-containing protein n=1 Tax=Hymenoscyphus fraxineus TaxID=746836 RepID=A0A9N9KQC7_9HELO|nr:hypothetical protein HYFRA_00000889 [Hymenoscyphus fraxineus]
MKSFTTIFILAIATLSIAAPSPNPQDSEFQARCEQSCRAVCGSFGSERALCPGDARDTAQCTCGTIGRTTVARKPSGN